MIYIHFPFCKSFCTYCDFYSVRERTKIGEYTESLLREISLRKAFLRECSSPSTLYVGGGTPSLWPVEQLEKVVAMLKEFSVCKVPEREMTAEGMRKVASVCGGHGGAMPDGNVTAGVSAAGKMPGIMMPGGDVTGGVKPGKSMPADGFAYDEFTVEVNPDDVSPDYAAALLRLGVNRVSMGVQSFSDRSLKWMNRRHSAAVAADAYGILRSAGFDNISMDLIFGYDPAPWGSGPSPEDELMRMWRDDLEAMLRLRPEHISAYQMGVEEGSVLGEKAAAGRYHEPSDELCASQYALLQQMLADAGYEQYEVSNFALPGRRAVHNSGYWKRCPYIGLGPGAHSFDGNRRRSWNVSDVDRYISALGHTPAVGTDSGLGSCPVHGADPIFNLDSSLGPGLAPTATHSSFRSFTSDRISGNDAISSIVSEEILTDEDVFTETIMLGLRTVDGLPLSVVSAGHDSFPHPAARASSQFPSGDASECAAGCAAVDGFGDSHGDASDGAARLAFCAALRTVSPVGLDDGSFAAPQSALRDVIGRFLADGSLILRDGRLCIPPDRLFISDSIIRGLL